MNARRLLTALALAVATAAPGPVAHGQVPEERNDIRVDVRSMTSALTPESESLVVRARAVNTTREPVRNLRMSLRFGSVLLGRSEIALGEPLARYGTRVADGEVPGAELAPGGTAEVEFDVPVADLPFDRVRTNGVYPLRIEIRSRYEVVGAADTYVVWWPQSSPKMRLAFLWPLVEASHRGIGDEFFDDDLAASVTDGRLDMLLALGDASPMPLTWAVDPEVLDALRRMAAGYTVDGVAGTSGGAARSWLDRAKTALRDDTVIPLPYADPDLTTSAGSLAVDAGTAFHLGREILSRNLGIEGSPGLAWPPGPTLSPPAEQLLGAQGVKGVVVPETALPLAQQLNYTPTAATPLAPGALGSMTALVADAQLNRWVAEGTRDEGPRLAVQRFVADSAMTAMERPGVLRDIVIAPPRTWDPVRGFAGQLLAQTAVVPWLTPVGLGTVFNGTKSTTARTRTPSNGGLLDPAYVGRVVAQRRSLQRLRGILTTPQHAPAELALIDDALLRAVSARWADDPGGGVRLVNAVENGIRRQLDRLRLAQSGVVTMTGRSGRIPLTFHNDFGQQVRVRVHVETKGRLDIEGKPFEGRGGAEVILPPGTHTLTLEGRATTGGLFPVRVAVLANDGAPLSIGTTVLVRSTAYGAVALVVTGIAFGLLLVASVTRLLRRRRRTARPGPAAAPDPGPLPG